MSLTVPRFTKALVVRKASQATPTSDFVNNAVLETRSIPTLQPGEVLVKINAAAFNHKDIWIRKGMYPDIGIGSVFGADGAGVVVASGDNDDPLLNQRVFLAPIYGWDEHPDGPESKFGIVGGVKYPDIGTFTEYVVVPRDKVIQSPNHLDDIHMAAWPAAGVTAWRATMINGGVQSGHHVLITGIGGGVALTALQLCIARGASVYVTSSSQEKIDRAVGLGAKGGANYKDPNWNKQIQALVKEQTGGQGSLDVVIDSGGGDIMGRVSSFLKHGGRVVCYGMTADRQITLTMREVLKNQKLLGSTMGSMKDLREATEFLKANRIVPVVSCVIDGLESAEKGFDVIKRGEMFGKVVVRIGADQLMNKARL